jgi:hypothetical protein
MKAFERCGTLADVRFLPPRASSNSELPVDPETGAWGTTRKHVRNDAGTRTSESVMCKFHGTACSRHSDTPVTQAPPLRGTMAGMPDPRADRELA